MSRSVYRLSAELGALMLAQSSMGLFWSRHYRDVEWIRATWFGNDWVTLVVAIPFLAIGQVRAARGDVRGLLLWLGIVGYAVYNYAFYLFGAALNPFFPLYVVILVLALIVLILGLAHVDVVTVVRNFRPATPVRLIGGCLVFVGIGLACVWIATWAAYVFAGRPTPVEPETFKLVAALDLSLMVPALTAGGVLLWRRMPWGYLLAAVASIQAALYLFVLSVNAVVAIQRGLASAPGELPIWGPLTILMTIIALVLWMNVRHDRVHDWGAL